MTKPCYIGICSNCGCSFQSDGGDVCPICFWAAGLAIFWERVRNLLYDFTHPAEVLHDLRAEA